MNSEEIAEKLRQLDEQAKKEGWDSAEQKHKFELAELEWLQEPDNQ